MFPLTLLAGTCKHAAPIAAYVDAIRAIHVEDIDVCSGVQAGYRSALAESGPLSHLEGCLWHFHRYLQRAGG